ncbi:MAG: cytochrome C [Thermodesulfovibrio sp.]|nr:cytochrome C [Thermodesulfovibrio sp.]
MKKSATIAAVLIFAGICATSVLATTKTERSGEELFKEHCSTCHPDGSNIINPGKTLRKEHRDAHNITTKADIVEKMRHPGKGMTSWSAATLPDEEAETIADYIIKTFK